MASALSILFLGCWLAGQSGARGEPRVSISASPGEVIAPGGALTIRCCCRFGGRLFLYKDGAEFRELYPAGDGGEFTIRSARREDAGSYSCESRAGWWLFQWAYDSDTLHISVAETYYPKPSISLLPSRRVALGGAVNIWCWGGPQNMRFLLSKEGTLHALQEVEPARDVAGFPIRNVSRQDAGSYRCYYRTPWDPAVRSRPSDPVELVVAEGTDPAGPQQSDPPTTAPQGEGRKGKGPSLLHSSLWLGGRRTGTPWLCLLELQQELLTWPQGATRGVGEPRGPAPPSTARRGAQPAGCWLAGWSGMWGQRPLPKPSISASPGGVIPVGGHVTIRCWTEQRGLRFLLYKDGAGNYLKYTDPAGSEAEFTIPSARREDGGSYTCRYGHRTGPAAYSAPSDPMQIIVADAGSASAEGTGLTLLETTAAPNQPAAPSVRLDFTHGNIARLGLGAGVLLALGLILAEAYWCRQRGAA